jgi:hypothetical protein
VDTCQTGRLLPVGASLGLLARLFERARQHQGGMSAKPGPSPAQCTGNVGGTHFWGSKRVCTLPTGSVVNWPDHFPADCPPAEASAPSGVVFRLVRGSTPSPADFISYAELRGPANVTAKLCQACGLSVFPDAQSCERMKKRAPRLREYHIAHGELRPEHGRLMATPSHNESEHMTWWVQPELANPERMFAVGP